MEFWSDEKLAYITEQYFRSGNSFVQAQRSFRKHFQVHGRAPVPSRKVILRVRNFRETGNINRKASGGVAATSRTPDGVETVDRIIIRSARKSVRRLAQEAGMSKTTVHRILRSDLLLFPYKVQITQKLQENDAQQRLKLAHWFIEKLHDDNFLPSLLMSDEAHFSLNGYVNKQNCRF